jgi:hypothetical protein
MITVNGSENSSVEPVVAMPKLPVMADKQGRLRVTKAQRWEILAVLPTVANRCPSLRGGPG